MSNWVSKLRGSGAPAVHTPQLLWPCMSPHAHTHAPPMHSCMPAALPMAMPSSHPHCPSKHTHMPIHPFNHMHHMPAHLYPHACRSAQHMRPLLHLVFFSSSFFSTLVMNMVKKNLYLIMEKPQNFGYFFCFF